MIRTAEVMSLRPKTEPYYRITASLLNSWQRIWDVTENVFESENDTVSVETKKEDAQAKAYQEFLNTLNRVPVPDNEYMKRGREFETDVQCGKDEVFSPIIKNGTYQACYTKRLTINGVNVCLMGILDWLKAGHIYDGKRVVRYNTHKYKTSHQHPMYFELVPEATDFTYLVMDDAGVRHLETYIPENCEDIKQVVAQFISWIKAQGLWENFTQNWNHDQLIYKKGKK